MKKIKRAIISLSNKKNLSSILKTLKKYKIEIISSGGTYKEIKKLKYKCTEISSYTQFSEILDGRVKTLHPKIHAGILSKRKNKLHKKQLLKNKFEEIDLVIVNFYPFENILKETKNHLKIVENIDIGGPTMARAAAKNYNFVTVITKPSDYSNLINELNFNKGGTSLRFRQKMSENAFLETAYYDSVITNYFNILSGNKFPNKKIMSVNLVEKLRYGENPHQEAAIYSKEEKLKIKQLSGKQLSYNNYNDIFSALNISKSLPRNVGTVIIKHANPCGVSINKHKIKSYKLALKCDPISAYGGIVCCNFKIKKELAFELNKLFLEVIIGNEIDKEALKILKRKKNLRIIDAKNLKLNDIQNINTNFNSFLIQSADSKIFSKKDFKVVSKIKPDKKTFDNLLFAFNVCRFVKSNAIVLANNSSTVGIGSGQPSRLDSCKIAINKMKQFQNLQISNKIVAASDAFFPFVDGIETLVQSGVSAVIQPSGSVRDKEIIKFADQTGTVLVFSKTRHFRH
ncbi:MAG: bifunctional phosphoribosylaminoimidazolecarboxamide formyltransferase/IMP cyclohydrolase [Pelagibacteraceae bacterium TMED268]|nr:MAG: bifunctional phosphoribosylaminoimidazolecarboxamide formyltransferase/IMP cyclohydrolase [Pelagibacteraceae bacterium TMED268]